VQIEGNVYVYTAVPIPINRIRKLFLSPTVNTIEMIHNTNVSIKTNSLTIFVPSAFYLIS
jgi:Na+-transporting NADH:ubiquinone oxidoreductase subunit NqrD